MEMVGVPEPNLWEALAASDCVVVVTDHSYYDWATVREHVTLVVDTRRVLGSAAARQPAPALPVGS
jgi:UDP-N-acetyl-D-glucosamine dehydrogenase